MPTTSILTLSVSDVSPQTIRSNANANADANANAKAKANANANANAKTRTKANVVVVSMMNEWSLEGLTNNTSGSKVP